MKSTSILLGLSIFLSLADVLAQNEPAEIQDNYFEYVEYWDNFWEERDYQGYDPMGRKYKHYMRFKQEMYGRHSSEGSMGEYFNAMYSQYQSQSENGDIEEAEASWCYLGPKSVAQQANGSYGYAVGKGLMSSLYVDPNNSDIIYAGAHNGGLWYTSDGGDHWINLTDEESELIGGVRSIAVDPTPNCGAIYIACGVGVPNTGTYTTGVFKSMDGGNSWERKNNGYISNSGNYAYNKWIQSFPVKLLIHPTNPQILYLLTTHWVMKTTDGGNNWSKVFDMPCYFFRGLSDIDMDPSDPDHLIISGSRTYETFNGFATPATEITFQLADNIHMPSSNHFSLDCTSNGYGVHRSTANTFFEGRVEFDNEYDNGPNSTNKKLHFAYVWIDPTIGSNGREEFAIRTTDRLTSTGNTWFTSANNGHMVEKFSFEQSPNHPCTFYTGALDCFVYYTCDGTTRHNLSNWLTSPTNPDYCHADVRDLWIKDNGSTDQIFSANDAGIAILNTWDPGLLFAANQAAGNQDWIDISDDGISQPGLNVTENHSVGHSEGQDDRILAAAQDITGHVLGNGSEFHLNPGGDGVAALVNSDDPNYMYLATAGSGASSGISVSSDGGQTFSGSVSGLLSGSHWEFDMEMHPSNPGIFFAAHGSRLYRVTGAKTSNPTATDLQIRSNMPSGQVMPAGMGVWAVEVAPSDGNVLYISAKCDNGCSSSGNFLFKSTNGGSSWTDITAGCGGYDFGMCMDIEVHATNPNKVWVTFASTDGLGEKIYYSDDGGANWSPFSGMALGYDQGYNYSMPVSDIEYVEKDDMLYIATEVGVFVRELGKPNMGVWRPFGEYGSCKLPLGAARNLMVNKFHEKIRVSVYGRGIWESDLYNCPNQTTLTLASVVNAEERVTDWIESTANITPPDPFVKYYAGKKITLKVDFHAEPNSEFLARIKEASCSCDCPEISAGNVASGERHANPNPSNTEELQELLLQHQLSISPIIIQPNPNSGRFVVKLGENEVTEMSILDMKGNVLFERRINDEREINIDLSGKPAGTYILRSLSGEEVHTTKFIIQ